MAKIIRLDENDLERLVKKIIREGSLNEDLPEADDFDWAKELLNDKSSRANNVRDLYRNPKLQEDAWGIAQMFPTPALDGLTGENVDGESVPEQNIKSMLNLCGDVPGFEKYSDDEWELFFEIIRREGI